MLSIEVALEVFWVGFIISIFMAAMIKGLLALINHAEKKMVKAEVQA